ncbi:TolC family protein [Terriglobus aquaticus]|uniref:TolC family protein n=1 Tax=Terriglobus aquaticus TaxID=940139 RepID=A0ABW9KPA3_9BACT|nr:TolC family protein [Terriglobus aquaticus]
MYWKNNERLRLTVAGLSLLASFAGGQTAVSTTAAPELTLEQAIVRAMANEPAFAAARADRDVSRLERTNARTAVLPTATYHNQAIYTQPNGVPASRIGQVTDAPSPVFIANNAVREYASQGVFNETLGLGQIAAIRLADANAARAEAELEIARRGLVSTVVSLYYGVGAGGSKLDIAREALAEADHFVETTQKREAQREVAHADVLKAQLTQQQRQRELLDAEVAAQKARLELAVLLYPDPSTPFTLTAAAAPPMLPERSSVEELARKNNPEVRSAAASLLGSQADTLSSQSALLPELNLNFTYGIDATNFGVNGPDGIRNLGYAMSAQVDIPVWDWLSTERKIKISRIREKAAKAVLTTAQRRAVASLQEFYAEAAAANKQLASLDASVTTARESLRLTELRYINGESTVLEVVDAQNTLSSAENARIDGNVRYQLALANLQTLTGTF